MAALRIHVGPGCFFQSGMGSAELHGGGEVARCIGNHGSTRVKKAVLLSAIPPIMLKTTLNPEGLSIDGFDKLRADLTAEGSQLYKDLAISFFGTNQRGAKVSKGILDSSWLWSMQSSWPTVLPIFSNCSANAEDWQGFLQEMPLRTIFFSGPFVALSSWP